MRHRAPLDADFFTIASRIDRLATKRIDQALRNLVGSYAGTLGNSLEAAASYLYLKSLDSGLQGAHYSAFLNLLDLLIEVLAATTNEIKIGPRALPYRVLLSELKRLRTPEDLTIITFNYDLVLERTLDIMASKHPGFFVFPGCYRLRQGLQTVPAAKQFTNCDTRHVGAALLKLHGSMNWQSAHTSTKPSPSALLSPKRELFIRNNREITPSKRQLLKKGKRKSHAKPIIVPPVNGKRGVLHQDILPLWAAAAAALREADRVVVTGYSCPPLDVEARILLSENLHANTKKRVYIVDPNPATSARFLEFCGVDHMTVYTDLQSWLRDARP